MRWKYPPVSVWKVEQADISIFKQIIAFTGDKRLFKTPKNIFL